MCVSTRMISVLTYDLCSSTDIIHFELYLVITDHLYNHKGPSTDYTVFLIRYLSLGNPLSPDKHLSIPTVSCSVVGAKFYIKLRLIYCCIVLIDCY